MKKRLGVVVSSVLVLVVALSVFATLPAAAAGPDPQLGGPSWDKAQWMSCRNWDMPGGDWQVAGKIKAGEHKWFAYQSEGKGRTTGAVLDSSAVVNKTWAGYQNWNSGSIAGVYFQVWSFLKRPQGLTLEVLGRGTSAGAPYTRDTWRGGADGAGWAHYFEIVNQTEEVSDFSFYLNCKWPISYDTINTRHHRHHHHHHEKGGER
jgi:hypothetical protein